MFSFRQEFWLHGQRLFATRFAGEGEQQDASAFVALEQARQTAHQLASGRYDFTPNEVELRIYKETPEGEVRVALPSDI